MCSELSYGRDTGICLLWAELETTGEYPLQVGRFYFKSEIFHTGTAI